MDGEPADSTRLELPANAFVTQVWTVSNPVANIAVALVGNDPQASDDTATLGLALSQPRKVALVTTEAEPVAHTLKSIRIWSSKS